MFEKITAFAVMAVLCLSFSAFGQSGGAVEVTAKGIQVGQMVPDVVLSGLHNYKGKDGKVVSSAKLSDFRGKLLILDFWATWCSPCVAMIPRTDSLQRVFGDKVQFLSVAYQSDREVLPFMEKLEKRAGRRYSLPMMTDDKVLRGLFPHKVLPHYVWINGNGRVMAITGLDQVNGDAIGKVLGGGDGVRLAVKRDDFLDYDYKRPLFDSQYGAKLLGHSILTGFAEGFAPVKSYHFSGNSPMGKKRITITNLSMVRLFQIALGKGTLKYNWRTTILSAKDSLELRNSQTGNPFMDWLRKGKGYCYELIVPFGEKDPFVTMENDLRKHFSGYRVEVVTKKATVLVLKRKLDKGLGSLGGERVTTFSASGFKMKNARLAALNGFIDYNFGPVADESGITIPIDLEVDADMTNIQSLNTALMRFGLVYEAQQRDVDFLHIQSIVEATSSLKLNERYGNED